LKYATNKLIKQFNTEKVKFLYFTLFNFD